MNESQNTVNKNALDTPKDGEKDSIDPVADETVTDEIADAEVTDAEMEDDASTSEAFENLLQYLKNARSFDFTGYKRSSLKRRVERRLQEIQVPSFADYIDYLEVHPDEFSQLFNSILINVTGFFRDPMMWDYLTETVLPRLLSARQSGDPLRIWSAGCATGAEAYTLAIVLAEALGPDAFRERVKIYATDVDDDALATARQALYSPREVSGVPARFLTKYFEQIGGQYLFHKDLRRAVIFGRHDLLKDAPISRVDILVCRNTLMYFNAETQAEVLTRLNFALNDDGFMFLGKAEMLFAHSDLFTPLELKRRIFTKITRNTNMAYMRDRLLATATGSGAGQTGTGQSTTASVMARLREQAFDTGAVPQIVVDLEGKLALVNERARQKFRLGTRDVGRMFQDSEISYRPLELRSPIEQALSERRAIDIKDVLWTGPTSTDTAYLDVHILPLVEPNGSVLGVSIAFTDMTRYKKLQQQLEESNRELETAYEELQSTNEELETTNEELQSTVEELETTNEELQSTNEELETMNEELQSTNEELETLNEEMQNRSSELNHVNTFLSSILGSMNGGIVVLDREMTVQIWNSRSEDLWGLRLDEVRGRYFFGLDIGFPVEEIRASVRACLTGGATHEERTLRVTNRRGRAMACKVICTPLLSQTREILGVILVMDEAGQG